MTKKISIVLLVFVTIFLFGCKNKKGFKEKDGLYIKENEEYSELDINFSLMDNSYVAKEYQINSKYKKICFIGDANTEYSSFSIKIEPVTNNIELVFDNFSFSAASEKVAIDASDVNTDVLVTLTVKGQSTIKGGMGKIGKSGTSFDYNYGYSTTKPGEQGGVGKDGAPAIIGNNILLNIEEESSLIVIGGFGGNGGAGGNGGGAAIKGIGQAGHGAKGGNGGAGNAGMIIKSELSINNRGSISIIGGSGGKGGIGGHGGENKDTKITDRADNAGNGGRGGKGGIGAMGLFVNENTVINILENKILKIKSGAGGNGGKGGAGGSSTKNQFQTSNGGSAGNGGDGGNGGNTYIAVVGTNKLDDYVIESQAGKGAAGGNCGYDYNGAGRNGYYGENGYLNIEYIYEN